ncbi:MAG TPA: hypothetical protein VFJ79_01000, partial [Acidimicrobiales bacterium]|nr:hypothetical protein [Acidimicrobiales bacterium]
MATRSPIAPVLAKVIGPGKPIAFEAYDGSSAGPAGALSRVIVKDPRALSYVATAPSDLGLARAYVSGCMDLEGDMFTTLEMLAGETVGSLSWADRFGVLRDLGPGILRPVAPPPEEVHPGPWWGLRHSLSRDS